MKRIISLLCIGTVICALSASGAPDPPHQKAKRSATGAKVATSAKAKGATMRGGARAQVRAPMRAQRSVARAPRQAQRSVVRAPQRNREFTRNSRGVVQRNGARTRREMSAARERTAREQVQNNRATAAARERQLSTTQQATARQRQVATARERNFGGGRAWRMAQNRNVRVVNTWRSNQFSGAAYAPFRNYARVYHNHDWYHHHYSDVVFVLGGWWYWNAGYWYPAWGYAPYSYYPYDGPVYTGYASLTPDRVSIEVQRQLQQDGYYAGPIDGRIGPMTRRALAAFQADNGLAVTSAIDEPTLSMMGIS